MNLIIVESPNKIKTIQSYLSDDYVVMASYGHLREMNTKNGFNPTTFEPNWVIIEDKKIKISKKKIIEQIIKTAKESNKIFLATDPDREGEAIAWHIYDILGKKEQEKCCRITFNEITEKAINNAIANAHSLDMNLVHSQFARRVIDRLIGYKLSGFIRSSVHGKSAGRVQSVALMFIVNRKLERDAFVPSKWFEISAKLDNGLEINFFNNNNEFKKYDDGLTNSHKFKFADKSEADKVFSELTNEFKFVEMLPTKITKGDKFTPLTTDKLLQLAGNNFGWSAAKTTLAAQKLFEGVELNDGTHVAYITYPRTDSTRINAEFVKETKNFIVNNFGQEYIDNDFSGEEKKTKKDNNVQDAHEAIRPVDCNITPEHIKNFVDDSSYKLYSLIWNRTVACMMTKPEYEITGLIFNNSNHLFYGMNRKVRHNGYLVLDFYKKIKEQYQENLFNFEINKEYKGESKVEEFDKLPPPYFTQASLIAALKESGVGRPSTYATMAKIGETRGYVNEEKQKLIPTEMGVKVINELQKDFSDVINAEFTSLMETNLDKIANGDEVWTSYLKDFAPEFEKKLKIALKESAEQRKNNQVSAERNCPKCNSMLLIKESRYGTKFVGCSAFPKCRYVEFDNTPNLTGEKCPECGSDLIRRNNRYGQEFVGCSGYPKCHYIKKEN